jgi:hypothetical protein
MISCFESGLVVSIARSDHKRSSEVDRDNLPDRKAHLVETHSLGKLEAQQKSHRFESQPDLGLARRVTCLDHLTIKLRHPAGNIRTR